MASVEAEEMIALALVFVVHVVGGLMLVWALLDADQRSGWRRRWRRGGGDDPPQPQPPPSLSPSGSPHPATTVRTPLPLPAAAVSRVRLRDPGRAADSYPRPARRPAHEPQPRRAPVPGRQRQRRG